MNNVHLSCTCHDGITFALITAKNRKDLQSLHVKVLIRSEIRVRALLRGREESDCEKTISCVRDKASVGQQNLKRVVAKRAELYPV